MKALVYTGVQELTYRDVADPAERKGEVLVKIASSGICGSDMHAFLGHDDRRPAPLILGHEAAGTVVRDGRRVTINPLVNCQTCIDCQRGDTNICQNRQIISMPPREGAFAQFVSMPERNLIAVPDAIPLDHAATAEPIACGWQGARQGIASFERPAETLGALVIGGGAIGVGAALSLAAQGVQDITLIEPNPARRDRLSTLKGIAILAPDAPDVPARASVDLVIDAVGLAATRATACTYVRQGGTIAHIGLGDGEGGLDIRRMTLQGIRFFGIYTYTAEDFRQTAQAIFDGRLGTFDWIESRPLANGAQAFADIRAGSTAAAKIILHPDP